MSTIGLIICTICYVVTFVDLLMKGDFWLGWMFFFYGASCVCLIFKVSEL
jgi:hypothetical protein